MKRSSEVHPRQPNDISEEGAVAANSMSGGGIAGEGDLDQKSKGPPILGKRKPLTRFKHFKNTYKQRSD